MQQRGTRCGTLKQENNACNDPPEVPVTEFADDCEGLSYALGSAQLIHAQAEADFETVEIADHRGHDVLQS